MPSAGNAAEARTSASAWRRNRKSSATGSGPGTVKATYGTGSSLMALTSTLIADTSALARTIAWAIDGTVQFALEGNIPMTGAAIQWVGEFLHLPNPAAGAARLAAAMETSEG